MALMRSGHFAFPVSMLALAVLMALTGLNRQIFLVLHESLLLFGGFIWENLTILGDAAVTPLILVVFIRKRPDLLWAALIGSLLAYGLSHGLKHLANEPRPPAVLDIVVVGPRLMHGSFPSGHATTIFMLAGLLILGLPIRSRLGRISILAAAALIGLSRIGVGVHWPSDILVGAATGWLASILGIYLAKRWKWGKEGMWRFVPLFFLFFLAVYTLFGNASGYTQAVWLANGISLIAIVWGIMEIYLWREDNSPG